MSSQVMIRLDEKKKKRMSEKAKAQGVSMQVIFSYLADAWLDGQMELKMQPVNSGDMYTAEDHEAWLAAKKDLEN